MLIVIKVFVIIILLFFCQACSKNYTHKEIKVRPEVSWAKGMVWYQIFPERYYNGSSENDPIPEEVPKSGSQPGWQPHPWASDWYKLQPWELKSSNKFYDVVFERRYGGDLIGVIQKLDYLKALGVGGIYFNPIFEGESLHKYDGASYHHIEDNFGPNPAEDKRRIALANETDDPDTWIWTKADSTFLKLIKEAHKRDIKIVIDGVFNHTGTAFFAFKDIVEEQQKSIYAEWYDVIEWDDPDTEKNEFDHKGWWGYKPLPELKEDENGIVSGPREYIKHATARWLDPNGDGDPSDGIDGWRLDVAPDVARPFWQEWNAHVKSINPKAITIAEIWDNASEWIETGCFDGTMNYLFAKAVIDFFIDQKTRITGQKFTKRLDDIYKTYGFETHQLLWSMLDSHDTDRLASMILNPDRDYDRDSRPSEENSYDVNKPGEMHREIQKQIAAFQMFYLGAPVIYYGTEAGMWGADDPDDRKPMLWSQFEYDDEQSHPIKGKTRRKDENKFDQQLFDYYQRIIDIREKLPAFKYGDLKFIKEAVAENNVGFSREFQNQQVLAFFNRADNQVEISINKSSVTGEQYLDIFSEKTTGLSNDKFKVKIPATGFLILVSV